ncbi:MAG: L,D-transpeptidase [Candidatus Curtissbacteria bacterium]|nr:L,D-transpeptidase [Candidatus Curtissbacteria bacterium]
MRRALAAIFFCLLFLFPLSTVHAQIYTNEKLITVDLGSQTLRAWQDGKIVHQTKVSTGMNLTPTVKGNFRVTRKIAMHDMRGPSPYKNIYPSGKYHIKNVPNSLYFYQAYAIHGAYWHNNFGRRASHGCVNVPLASAQWLFDWAGTGTLVSVF